MAICESKEKAIDRLRCVEVILRLDPLLDYGMVAVLEKAKAYLEASNFEQIQTKADDVTEHVDGILAQVIALLARIQQPEDTDICERIGDILQLSWRLKRTLQSNK